MGKGVEEALSTKFALLHVMGDHSNMRSADIIDYKTKDVAGSRYGYTLWAQHSHRAKPEDVRALCEKGDVYLFLLASPKGKKKGAGKISSAPCEPDHNLTGQQVLTDHVPATHYSASRDAHNSAWRPITELRIADVLDNPKYLASARSYALVIGELRCLSEPISLKDWADVTDLQRSIKSDRIPVRFGQGRHVVCGERFDMSGKEQMKSFKRVIISAAKLVPPYAVWLKSDGTAERRLPVQQ